VVTHFLCFGFCKENTKLLDLDTNPFLRILKSKKGPEYLVFVNNFVHVEICYTERIPLSSGQLKEIQPFGSGMSMFGGNFLNFSVYSVAFRSSEQQKLPKMQFVDCQEEVTICFVKSSFSVFCVFLLVLDLADRTTK
jgi:hypothetical protein